MRPDELREAVQKATIYKMSLGKDGNLEEEALRDGALMFQSERRFFEAVKTGDAASILRTGKRIINDSYRSADAPDNAIGVWRRTIETFETLPAMTLILHWETDNDRLRWGLTSDQPVTRRAA
jgi:hypothetical protein